eukprot:TRINITY_DN14411_c0_g2_i2.p1 TRINITY_DN14411_c0_g2~~TRINITY_DN14411_c0_g2_i2.p1  ORF type:complete len:158 (+),score=39.00 TRINITY_DN14411_c0_g2_i2:237-710(+)
MNRALGAQMPTPERNSDPLVLALSQRVQYLSEQLVASRTPPPFGSPKPESPSDLNSQAEAALISMTQLLHAAESEKAQAQDALVLATSPQQLDLQLLDQLDFDQKAELRTALELDISEGLQRSSMRETELYSRLNESEARMHEALSLIHISEPTRPY